MEDDNFKEKELIKSYEFNVYNYGVGKKAYKGGDIIIILSGNHAEVVSKTPTTIEELKKYADIYLHEYEQRVQRRRISVIFG